LRSVKAGPIGALPVLLWTTDVIPIPGRAHRARSLAEPALARPRCATAERRPGPAGTIAERSTIGETVALLPGRTLG
jgi:hypothetical protein